MGAVTHLQGEGFNSSHTTVTEGAKPVLEILRKLFPAVRITNDIIERNVKARSFSIKVVPESGANKMTVITNGAKQVFYLYGCPATHEMLGKLRSEKKLRSYFIRS